MRYKLMKKLVPMKPDEAIAEGEALVEIMGKEEYWKNHHTHYEDHLLIRNLEKAQYCRTELLKNCIIGTLVIPVKEDLLGTPVVFGYYMNQDRLIFVDESGEAVKMLHQLEKIQIFEKTGVCHLFFDLLELLVRDESGYLQACEERLTEMEDQIMSGSSDGVDVSTSILRVRKELAKVSSYYGQLLNMSQTLTENYNGLLKDEDCALFHLFSGRIRRLVEHGKELREYALQIREMHQVRVDMKQNQALSFLTMVTSIFAPLGLIAGWYGMNFKNMPELSWNYGYYICILVSIIVILGEVWYFNRNGWFKK